MLTHGNMKSMHLKTLNHSQRSQCLLLVFWYVTKCIDSRGRRFGASGLSFIQKHRHPREKACGQAPWGLRSLRLQSRQGPWWLRPGCLRKSWIFGRSGPFLKGDAFFWIRELCEASWRSWGIEYPACDAMAVTGVVRYRKPSALMILSLHSQGWEGKSPGCRASKG